MTLPEMVFGPALAFTLSPPDPATPLINDAPVLPVPIRLPPMVTFVAPATATPRAIRLRSLAVLVEPMTLPCPVGVT